MRYRVNPFFEPGFRPPSPAPAAAAFHAALPAYEVTPLHDCRGLAGALGLASLTLKDESGRFGLGAFKALGAAWAVERIRRSRPGTRTLATATEGNHGRAVAWAARRLGLPAKIFIPAHGVPARVERIRQEGARVEQVPGSYEDAVARCAAESARQGWQVVSDAGYDGYLEIPGWIAEGYGTLFEEAAAQREAAGIAAPNLVLIQTGVGALLHAAVRHFRSRPHPPVLVAVEPLSADAALCSIESPEGRPTDSPRRPASIMAGLNCARVSLTAWPELRRGVQLFLCITDEYAERAMRLLATPTGDDPPIEAGATGVAGLAGLLALLEAPELAPARDYLALGRTSRVLAIVSEGVTDPDHYARVLAGGQSTVNGERSTGNG